MSKSFAGGKSNSFLGGLLDSVNEFLGIEGTLKFKVSREGSNFSFPREVFDLPFPQADYFPWSLQNVPYNIEVKATQNKVAFDSYKIIVSQYPGPMEESIYWTDVDLITSEVVLNDNYFASNIKVFGNKNLCVEIPCQGAHDFLKELKFRYGIDPEKVMEILNSKIPVNHILWAKQPNSKLMISNQGRLTSLPDFGPGFSIENKLYSWELPVQEFLNDTNFEITQKMGVLAVKSKHPVQIGNWLLPEIYFFNNGQFAPYDSPEAWYFQFVSIDPPISESELKSMFGSHLLDEMSWVKTGPFRSLLFLSNGRFALSNETGIWKGSFSETEKRAKNLRLRHPMTLATVISKILMSPVSASHISSQNLVFPSPDRVCQIGLCFWKDEANQFYGLSVLEISTRWSPREHIEILYEIDGYDNDRGGMTTVYLLNIQLNNGNHIKVELSGPVKESFVKEINSWFGRSQS